MLRQPHLLTHSPAQPATVSNGHATISAPQHIVLIVCCFYSILSSPEPASPGFPIHFEVSIVATSHHITQLLLLLLQTMDFDADTLDTHAASLYR
jgi:hypothetical protein